MTAARTKTKAGTNADHATTPKAAPKGNKARDAQNAAQSRALALAQIENFKANRGITCDKIPSTETERIAKWNKENPGKALSTESDLTQPQKPGARHSHKRAADASPEHCESPLGWPPRPWLPSERAKAAVRLFENTKRKVVAGVPRCASTAEHRKQMVEYRGLMFMAAKAELDKYLAKHSDPIQTLLSDPEWADLVGKGKLRFRYALQTAARLVAKAEKGDPVAWEAARRLAARLVEQGDPLPPELRGFAVDVLLGKIAKPKRSRSDHVVVRDAAIRAAADVLEFHHNFIPLTRNKASAPGSICDAIAEALNKRGEDIGYAAVAKVVINGYPTRRK